MVDYLKKFSNLLSGAFSSVVDYALPPVCGNCREPVQSSTGICGPCWATLTFLSDPCCACCGYPFEFFVEEKVLCGECHRVPKSFDRCRAALAYDKHSKDMVIGFKHADRTNLAQLFTRWLTLAGGEAVESVDLVMPVPLHPRRLLARRYNQSGLLAQKVARRHLKKYLPDVLIRTKNTVSQGHLSQQQRWNNVKSSFKINPRYRDYIRDKRILLIDDVYTTGATLEACSRVLRKCNVASIDALVLARVVKESGR